MEIFVSDTYEAMSKQAAGDVIRFMGLQKAPLICAASGHSPSGLYEEIAAQVHQKKVDASDWYFVALDEWVGLNGNDEGSCMFHLKRELFDLLDIDDSRICFFDGREKDLGKECENVDNYIKQHGGIHVAILGVGMNGHVGMNEPGTSPSLRTHVTDLDPITQKVGQKYFKEEQHLTKGITLGLASLMEARHLVVLASGSHKAEIIKKVLTEEISQQLPASLLRNHPGLRVYLDADAAQML
jgi:galactosamine-6-phosphate isomerase